MFGKPWVQVHLTGSHLVLFIGLNYFIIPWSLFFDPSMRCPHDKIHACGNRNKKRLATLKKINLNKKNNAVANLINTDAKLFTSLAKAMSASILHRHWNTTSRQRQIAYFRHKKPFSNKQEPSHSNACLMHMFLCLSQLYDNNTYLVDPLFSLLLACW